MHHNIQGGGIPIWFMVLFVYFAYDDVFRMLMNPLLFYPIMLLVSVGGMRAWSPKSFCVVEKYELRLDATPP